MASLHPSTPPWIEDDFAAAHSSPVKISKLNTCQKTPTVATKTQSEKDLGVIGYICPSNYARIGCIFGCKQFWGRETRLP